MYKSIHSVRILEHSQYTSQRQFLFTSSFARFSRSATSPLFAYVSNQAPDSSLCRAAAPRLHPLAFSCCSPIASASASAAAPRLRPLQLLFEFPDFNSSPDCVRFGCCSLTASTSTAAPRLRPLQLRSSPIASASTAAPRLHPLVASPVLEDSSPCPMFSNILLWSSTKLKYEGRASL